MLGVLLMNSAPQKWRAKNGHTPTFREILHQLQDWSAAVHGSPIDLELTFYEPHQAAFVPGPHSRQ